MSIDAEIDALKEKMVGKRLKPEQLLSATERLYTTIGQNIQSKRLNYELDLEDEEGPRISIFYEEEQFHIGDLWLQPDGTIAFHSNSEYFPELAVFENEQEFLKEAKTFLTEGLAAFELDEEDDSYEV